MAEKKEEIVVKKAEKFIVAFEFVYDKLYKVTDTIELSDEKIIEVLKTNKFIK